MLKKVKLPKNDHPPIPIIHPPFPLFLRRDVCNGVAGSGEGGGKLTTMNVTKPTAHKLAAAGYPQPKNTGQGAWYADDIGETISTAVMGDVINWSKMPGAVYAPNITELFIELRKANGWSISLALDIKWIVVAEKFAGGWEAILGEREEMAVFEHADNPAEALAECLLFILSKNEKCTPQEKHPKN